MSTAESVTAGPARVRDAPALAWTWEWTKRLGAVGGAQTLVQGLGFATGILVVRMLPTREYALYTLVNTLLGTMTVLSDGGISSGVMAEGGKVWQDADRLGRVVATGLRLRRLFTFWSLAVWTPVLLFLLRSHGAPWGEVALLLAATGAFCWFAFLGSVHGLAPALWQRLRDTQRISIEQNAGRLGGSAAALLAWPNAAMAVGATLAAQIWATFRLRRLSGALIGDAQAEDPAVRREVLKIVRRILPVSVYFCLSSQLTVWLISLRGSTTALAQVGALGRLGQIFTLFSAVVAMVVLPRFARLGPVRGLVIRRYLQVMALLGFGGAAVAGLVALYPHEALWILGPGYAGLTYEVELATVDPAQAQLIIPKRKYSASKPKN